MSARGYTGTETSLNYKDPVTWMHLNVIIGVLYSMRCVTGSGSQCRTLEEWAWCVKICWRSRPGDQQHSWVSGAVVRRIQRLCTTGRCCYSTDDEHMATYSSLVRVRRVTSRSAGVKTARFAGTNCKLIERVRQQNSRSTL